MSRPYGSLPDRHLREVEQRVAQQKALVHRMIVQGTPTQAAEDRLGELHQTSSRMNRQHWRDRAFEVQRAVRHHRSR
jgi:hypothetical protein